MTEEDSQHSAEADGSRHGQPVVRAGYDSYRSLADSNLIIIVPKSTIPPFRFKAGGWELLQSSIDLDPAAQARVAENGFFIMETANPVGSGELVPSDFDRPTEPHLEVEFALVIARMIDSTTNSPEDIRQIVYDLARYKLQEQLLQANAGERQHTQQALEVAIRGVEAFSEKQAQVLPFERQPQLKAPGTGSTDHERIPQVASSTQLEVVPRIGRGLRPEPERYPDRSVSTSGRRSYLRRTAAMIVVLVVLVVVLVAVQQRESLQNLARNLAMPERKIAMEARSAPPQGSAPVVSNPSPPKPALLQPKDYGVYAISNGALFDLSLLAGRPPDIRIAVSPPLTTPSRTTLPNGRLKFVVFSRDLASSIADRPAVRIVAKIAREFSAAGPGKKPAEDAWVIRNVSFPLRSSPFNDNPEMIELHSEDPALELTPGRYVLVLKNQAYDFSIEGKIVDPRQCIERIAGSTGLFYSDCKNP